MDEDVDGENVKVGVCGKMHFLDKSGLLALIRLPLGEVNLITLGSWECYQG